MKGIQSGLFKETRQNQRILDDMIQEAKTFDNRLKKLGMKINIDELINNDKEEAKKKNLD